MSRVSLTDQELAYLDGKCSDEVQTEVDAAKERLAAIERMPEADSKIAAFVADVVRHAQTKGKLIYRNASLDYCSVCGRNDGYHKYRRNSRHHRKGQPDRSKPIMFYGTELAESCIRFKGHATLGACDTCMKAAMPLLKAELADIRAEISDTIMGHPPKWKKQDRRKCKSCGWEGHEGQMGRLMTMMGDGTYPGKCPKCNAESHLFNQQFEICKGFDIMACEIPKAKQEAANAKA